MFNSIVNINVTHWVTLWWLASSDCCAGNDNHVVASTCDLINLLAEKDNYTALTYQILLYTWTLEVVTKSFNEKVWGYKLPVRSSYYILRQSTDKGKSHFAWAFLIIYFTDVHMNAVHIQLVHIEISIYSDHCNSSSHQENSDEVTNL